MDAARAASPARAAATRAAPPTSGCGRASDAAYAWLASFLTVERVPAAAARDRARCRSRRHLLPNLRALNFVVDGLLGEGVASNARHDPQAKAIGEWLRSRVVDIPEELLHD